MQVNRYSNFYQMTILYLSHTRIQFSIGDSRQSTCYSVVFKYCKWFRTEGPYLIPSVINSFLKVRAIYKTMSACQDLSSNHRHDYLCNVYVCQKQKQSTSCQMLHNVRDSTLKCYAVEPIEKESKQNYLLEHTVSRPLLEGMFFW